VVIVGFQAEGTLGRMLVEHRPQVKIFGEPIAVKAQIHTLNGFSAHAGQTDLLHWFEQLASARPRVFLTHGEAKGRQALAALISQRFGIQPELPEFGNQVEFA
jgi:metallo-beta-lactamase family protein